MSEPDEVIRLEAVTRRYARRSSTQVFTLAPVSLTIERGSWVVFAGRSGAGKTTLLQLMAGLDRPDAGRVWLFGREVSGDSESALSEIRRRRLGVVYQQFHFIDHMRVWENVTCRLVPAGVPARARRDRAARVLDELDLTGMLDRRPYDLSGGEQQRVALARAIVGRPEIVIADEPTSNVDAETGTLIRECLERLREEGATIVLSTHDPGLEERANQRFGLVEGKLVP